MSETELLPKPKREPEPVRRLEVFTGAGRRRRWTAEQKARIVAEKISIATLIFRYFLRYFSSTHRADLSRFRGTFHSFDPVGFAIFATCDTLVQLCVMSLRVSSIGENASSK